MLTVNPSRMQTRFCWSAWPAVAWARTRSRPCSRDLAGRFDDADQADHHHRVRGERAARRVDLDDVVRARARRGGSTSCGENGAATSATSTGARSDAGPLRGERGRRRLGEVTHAGLVDVDAVVDAADPHRPVDERRGPVTGGQDDRGRAVGDRREVVTAQRVAHVRLLSSASTSNVPLTCAYSLLDRVARGCGRRSRPSRARCATPASSNARGLQRGERRRVEPERREVVRVELQRPDLPGRARRRAPVAVHEHEIDVALLQAGPPLVHRPRAVHLDVRLRDRRPRADGLDGLHERERLAGEVVAAARHGEPDVVPVDARHADRLLGDVEHHLRLGDLGAAHRRDLPVADDRDVDHC